jgi:hypothetical protein
MDVAILGTCAAIVRHVSMSFITSAARYLLFTLPTRRLKSYWSSLGAHAFGRRDEACPRSTVQSCLNFMAEPLPIYLSDHLAGAMFAVELLKYLRDSHANEPLGAFAKRLLVEVETDRSILQSLYDEVADGGNIIKEAGSWFMEKTARLKLALSSDSKIGELEALEALCLGVWGKLKLWAALSQVVQAYPNLRELDFDNLAKRARAQHDELEAYRLDLAKLALAG